MRWLIGIIIRKWYREIFKNLVEIFRHETAKPKQSLYLDFTVMMNNFDSFEDDNEDDSSSSEAPLVIVSIQYSIFTV